MLLLEKKQTRIPFGFIQQSEEGSAIAGFTQDIAGPATSSFHWWAETDPEGDEGCRCLSPGTPWPRTCFCNPSHSEGKVWWLRLAHLILERPTATMLLALVMFPTPSTEPALSQSWWVCSASVCDPPGFFTSVSVCLSSQVLDKGTNYCGASHHCM